MDPIRIKNSDIEVLWLLTYIKQYLLLHHISYRKRINNQLCLYSYFRFGLIEPTYRDNLYGIPYPCRGLFIIDPSKVVRQMSFYPWSVGRSTSELIRTIDSLQLTEAFENKVCTPADWDRVSNSIAMVDSSVTKDDINKLFRSGIITYHLPSGMTTTIL